MSRKEDSIKKQFDKLKGKKFKINRITKNPESREILKQSINDNIDNKYLKFSNINKKTIIFKANKKFRDKNLENPNFHKEYISNFLSKVFKNTNIDLEPKKINIISDIYLDDGRVFVEF